jgi:hypothetical protein
MILEPHSCAHGRVYRRRENTCYLRMRTIHYQIEWKAGILGTAWEAYRSRVDIMRLVLAVATVTLLLTGVACGERQTSGDDSEAGSSGGETTASGETTARGVASSEAAELARAEVGPREETNMVPADGEEPDPARPLPENPPEGIEVYPATTNETVRGAIEYDRKPPTNGDHDPLWQNCGFYERPVQDRHAVHSLDHGVVWISYRPDLPKSEIDALRSYGDEEYVIVSPYSGQEVSVVATSWRVQLELRGADDPRLRRFVDQFRISELAPLSGNRCTGGVGDPDK